ncbi:MAG: superoxide dismutase family protein [Gammaproteobacteria bacterium]
MTFNKVLFGLFLLIATNLCHASLIVPMRLVDANGEGRSLGSIKLDDTLYGVIITPKLHNLPAGVHGFAVTECPLCIDYAIAAGGHLDPQHNDRHEGPYRGSGHLGDLPVLIVHANGRATLPVLAPRLKLAQMSGHSLVIAAGSDNYSDQPLKEYSAKVRIACGVIPYH